MILSFLGADPCIKSRAGFTALHMAAQEGHADCVEMLLDRQANVNDQANNGYLFLKFKIYCYLAIS